MSCPPPTCLVWHTCFKVCLSPVHRGVLPTPAAVLLLANRRPWPWALGACDPLHCVPDCPPFLATCLQHVQADKSGATALVVAAEHGHAETVRALLKAGADANQARVRVQVALQHHPIPVQGTDNVFVSSSQFDPT